MFILKSISKLLLLPFILILRLTGTLLYGAVLLSAKLVSPALTFIAICAVISAFGQHWRDAAILTACCLCVWLLYLAAGWLVGLLKMADF